MLPVTLKFSVEAAVLARKISPLVERAEATTVKITATVTATIIKERSQEGMPFFLGAFTEAERLVLERVALILLDFPIGFHLILCFIWFTF
jgi:hypothetical protein